MANLDLSSATTRLASLVQAVHDDQLDAPTPLPAYRVGELLDHIGGVARTFACAARKERNELTERTPANPSGPPAPGWRDVIPRDLAALASAWADPAAWDGTTHIAGDDSPAAIVGLVLADELVVHGWDLAQAIDAEYDAEPHLIAGARQFLEMVVSPDLPRGDAVAFGPPRECPHGASPLDQVLALCGRDLGWSPAR